MTYTWHGGLVTVPWKEPSHRRTVVWAASVAGASVVAAGVAIAHLPSDGGAGGAGAQASCVAPFLRADQRVSPPEPGHPSTLGEVRAGQSVTVYGHWYFAGPCVDTVTAGQPIPAPRALSSVRLLLTTDDHRATTLVTVHPQATRSPHASPSRPAPPPDRRRSPTASVTWSTW